MPSRVLLLLPAEQDLDKLFSYIAEESGIDRAELVLRRIETTLASLADWPGIGRIHHELEGSPRSFSVGPWRIFYEALPSRDGIAVWRILDGRRDLPPLIRPPPPITKS